MPAPFIYIGTYEVAEGRVDDARTSLAEHAEFVEANEPRLISFNFYLDPDARTVTVVQVHPDSASMDFHMQLIAEHISSALGDYLGAPVRTLVCGQDKEAVETIRSFSPDAPVSVATEHIAGFTRTTAA
jgi:quinol monooxygenase YgiN